MKVASLKDSLEGWTGPPKVPAVFEPRRARAAGRKVAEQLGGVEMTEPQPYDQKKLYQRIRESWGRENSLERISARDLRRVPFVLFYPPGQDNHAERQGPTGWLGVQPGFVREYGRWLSGGYRASSVRALLLAFLRVYPVGLETFHDLRGVLEKTMSGAALPPPSLREWTQRCGNFGILEEDGDLSFVEKLISATDPVDRLLGQTGFDAGLARCGFLESGIRKFLPILSARLAPNSIEDTQLSRVLALLECEGKLRFDQRSIRVEIASALLGPYMDTPPPADRRDQLQGFFLHHFGDPRLPSGIHRWYGVADEVRHVVSRWLVKEALDGFIRVVRETAPEHWEYREAFWMACFNRDLIEDAWFVLGSRARRLLSRLEEHRPDATGRLSGAEPGQSVLLLRMSGVTIAEWSYNGSCRFWLDGNRHSPKLYQARAYSGTELRRGSNSFERHVGGPSGIWQKKVARWLREHTGASINRGEYMPNKRSCASR